MIKYVNENYYAVKFNAEGNEKIEFQGYEFSNPNFDPAKTRRRNSSHEFTRALREHTLIQQWFFWTSHLVFCINFRISTSRQMEFFEIS